MMVRLLKPGMHCNSGGSRIFLGGGGINLYLTYNIWGWAVSNFGQQRWGGGAEGGNPLLQADH